VVAGWFKPPPNYLIEHILCIEAGRESYPKHTTYILLSLTCRSCQTLRSPSSISLLTPQPKIPPNNPPLSLDSNLEQLVRIKNVHATRHESEVVAAARNGELADEDARRVPPIIEKRKSAWSIDVCLMEGFKSNLHINAIAASARRVDITLGVGVDSVWEPSRGVGEELPVLQPLAVGRDVEAVDGGGLGCVVFAGEGLEAGI
jgi:hypothetical protein